MVLSLQLAVVLALQLGNVFAATVQPYESLAGLSREEIEVFARGVKVVGAQPPPPPIKDTSLKLVNDKDHPWQPLRDGDQRGK